jgi:hypothetical protein
VWIVRLTLARPCTFIVFPSTSLVPSEMETRIVSIFGRSPTTSLPLNGVAVIKVLGKIHHDKLQALVNRIASSALGVLQSIKRHARRARNTNGGLGLSPDRPNRKNGETCSLYRQRSGECYPQQRMHITVSSHGVSGALDWRSVCG